ncbi:hypothetical protein [Chitinophaga japonensis]|uniref:Lipocalin-like protein n=1 Tax=Chitinophaga japonensis TaxID=104662 RepID=A0A562SS33_CHIJA|nr:hypothetical protein [Chitinophaga japonensis]TWI84051.1 hypothetical protein LX66_4413 [Chitinophaga japonensis]
MKITRLLFLLTAATTITFFASCSKDDDQPDVNAIQGTWDFVNMISATVSTTINVSDDYKDTAVIVANYVSKNNGGTVMFDATTVKSSDFTYMVDTVLKAEYFASDGMYDAYEIPFSATIPKSSSTAPYKLVGTDSIYFEQGFINMVSTDGSGTIAPTTASGSRLTWSGDTLVLLTHINASKTETGQGVTTTTIVTGTQVVKLLKQ